MRSSLIYVWKSENNASINSSGAHSPPPPGNRRADRQTDRHVFIWGLIQRKYIDYNSK